MDLSLDLDLAIAAVMGGGAATAAYHIVALLGQSNMAGRGIIDSSIDTDQANVKQYPNIAANTATYRTIRDSIQPLYHPDNRINQSDIKGPGDNIGKVIVTAYAGHNVLLVPCAYGNTSLVNAAANSAPSPPQWAAGGTLTTDAIAQTNAAIAAAQAIYPSSSFHSFHWHQGEADTSGTVSQSQYYDALVATIAAFRAGVTGASSAPFVVGGLQPESIIDASHVAIDNAHRAAAANLSSVYFVPGQTGYTGTGVHYNAAGYRDLGSRMGGILVGASVLASGAWNDAAPWNDASTWKDS